MLVEKKLTEITAVDFAKAIRATFPPEYLSNDAVRVLVAHSAFETGWWRYCYNYNFGNKKCFNTAKPHYQTQCNERLKLAVMKVDALPQEWSPCILEAVDVATNTALITFYPGSSQANFAAFDDLPTAVLEHVNFILQRTTLATPGNSGEALVFDFCEELREAGYFTANFDTYVKGVKGCYNMLEGIATVPSFPVEPGKTARERLADIALAFAAAGNKSWQWLERGTSRNMSSCAITARAIWWHAGCAGFGVYTPGMPIYSSIIEPARRLGAYSKYDVETGKLPKTVGPGDVFYIDNATRTNAHIGMFVSYMRDDDTIDTVEGGQAGVHVQKFTRKIVKKDGKLYLVGEKADVGPNSRQIVGVCYADGMCVPTAPLKQEIKAAESVHERPTVPNIILPPPPDLSGNVSVNVAVPPIPKLPAELVAIEQKPPPVEKSVTWTLVSIGIGLLALVSYFMRSC